MHYTLQKLQSDVMARLGEYAQAPASDSQINFLSVEDVISCKIKSQLPIIGRRLLAEAADSELGGAEAIEPSYTMKLMPCGLYAADISLQENIVRIVSVKMESWKRDASQIILPGSASWNRQWSSEQGIAGCADRPHVYLIADGNGLRLRALGSPNADDSLSFLYAWRIPEPGNDGNFRFPASLYPSLVDNIL